MPSLELVIEHRKDEDGVVWYRLYRMGTGKDEPWVQAQSHGRVVFEVDAERPPGDGCGRV